MKCSCGGEYRCDTCGAKVRQPTKKQLEAYRLVYIHGCTHAEAGGMVGVSHQAITQRLQVFARFINRHEQKGYKCGRANPTCNKSSLYIEGQQKEGA